MRSLVSGLWLTLLTAACSSVGDGEGAVRSASLIASDCWNGAFDLRPDFFAANPFRDTLQIRLQRGSDIQEVSDGVWILVHELSSIRPRECTLPSECASRQCVDGTCLGEDRRGEALTVGLPSQLALELAPSSAPQEPDVSLALYLQSSCPNQNVVLYAIDGTVTFEEIFSGDPNELSGAEKLTRGRFSVTLADPRDAPVGTLEVPAELTSPLEGTFEFVFERGQPGQPFP